MELEFLTLAHRLEKGTPFVPRFKASHSTTEGLGENRGQGHLASPLLWTLCLSILTDSRLNLPEVRGKEA